MSITTINVPDSDDPASAIFNVWYDASGLSIPRDIAWQIYSAGLQVGASANFRASRVVLRAYAQPEMPVGKTLLIA